MELKRPFLRMGQLDIFTILCLALMFLLHVASASNQVSSSRKPPKTSKSTSLHKTQRESRTQANYHRQSHPHPPSGSNLGTGQPNQQYFGSRGVSPGRYPNQNPIGGRYPAGGSKPVGGNNPARGGYPVAGRYPARGSNPSGGSYPAGGRYPHEGQYPRQGGSSPGGYPNQHHGGGRFPNQYPSGGSYPSRGQYPVRRGVSPNQYPMRRGNTAAGGYTNQYPGGYPISNPTNKNLSPRDDTRFVGPGYRIGGSPYSRILRKRKRLAARNRAMRQRAVTYCTGRFPRPHSRFSRSKEMHYDNHYMHSRYNKKTIPTTDTFKQPLQTLNYESYMEYMNRTDFLQNHDTNITTIQDDHPITASPAVSGGISEGVGTAKNGTSEVPVHSEPQESNDETVSIPEIVYPAPIQQMKFQKCVRQYLAYSRRFLQRQAQRGPTNHSNSNMPSGLLVLFMTAIMVLSSGLLL